MRDAVTVSQLNRYVKSLLSENKILNEIMVRGELSNFVRHYKSGHLYFTLKDSDASIKGVMFRGNSLSLRFEPENGMSVVVSGSVTLYERDGSYQLYAQDIQPDGVGALYLAFEQLKERLSQEGLFSKEHKRSLPAYPEVIGIITSEGAAALQDMLHVLGRRYPAVKILFCPAQVQGDGAAKMLQESILRLNKTGCDVIIIGRGGGSMEDLWAFNDEALARTIAASKIPVISAVGHETDFTIADFAADLRAPTPSAAAELAVPNGSDVLYYLDSLLQRCTRSMMGRLDNKKRQLQELRTRLVPPMGVLEGYARRLGWAQREIRAVADRHLDMAVSRLERGEDHIWEAVTGLLEWKAEQLHTVSRLIEAASPVRNLERGFSLTTSDGRAVVSVADVSLGDVVSTRVTDGIFFSKITEIK